MSDLFNTHPEISQHQCDSYARQLGHGNMTPAAWQGYHSYTLLLESEDKVVQFRSAESPLNPTIADLARGVHDHLAPRTKLLGNMPGSSVLVWLMDKIPGVGYLFTVDNGGVPSYKLRAVVEGLAKSVLDATPLFRRLTSE